MKAPVAILSILTVVGARNPAPTPFVFHHENVMGTSFSLKVQAAEPAFAESAESAALAEIDRLTKILSTYDAQSEVSRWARTRDVAVPVSPELFEVLQAWDTWRERSGGVLQAGIAGADAEAMQRPHWRLNADARTATRLDDTPLRLNSFTKSWVLERAARAAFAAAPVEGVVVDGGGDLIVRGVPQESVAVRNPFDDAENAAPVAYLNVADRAVATSGNYRRGAHIIDPRTGRPAAGIASSTVIAKDEVTAGALATAFNVLTPEESQKLAAKTPGVEYVLLASNGQRLTNIPGLQFAAAAQAGGPEVNLQFELARVADGRYRRPYVAVWVEDKDHFPVRTLALWYEKPRWLPDLKAWSRGDRLRHMAEGTDIASSVSSATRPPGKYSVKWDGKDQAGKPVKAGKYTLYLEAAREHGTYQLMQQEIDLTGAAAQYKLAANTEVASATVEFKKP